MNLKRDVNELEGPIYFLLLFAIVLFRGVEHSAAGGGQVQDPS